jgi:hypothetical protein
VVTLFEIHTLTKGWTWDNFAIEGIELDYCCDVLNIPNEYIEDVWYEENTIMLELELSDDVHSRKWFYKLNKVAIQHEDSAA